MDSQYLFGTSKDTDSCLLLRAVGVTGVGILKRGVGVVVGGAVTASSEQDLLGEYSVGSLLPVDR